MLVVVFFYFYLYVITNYKNNVTKIVMFLKKLYICIILLFKYLLKKDTFKYRFFSFLPMKTFIMMYNMVSITILVKIIQNKLYEILYKKPLKYIIGII